MDYTPRIGLPLIHTGQAQKEITHNEALMLLDVLINPVVQAISVEYLPDDAQLGQLFVIAPITEGEIANHQNELALKLEHGWRFVIPRKWLEITLDTDGSKYCWNGEHWMPLGQFNNDNQYIPNIALLQTARQNNLLINKENGEYLRVGHLEEELQLQGAYVDTTIQIPHHTIVIAVNVRVLEQINSVNSFSVGTIDDITRYGQNLNTATDTTNIGLTNQPLTYWADTSIRITAAGGAFMGGRVHVTIQYLKPHGPWHWE